MRKKLIYITLVFISIISIITLISLETTNNGDEEVKKGRQLIYLNEVRNEIEQSNLENEILNESLDKLEGEISERRVENNNNVVIIYRYIINIIFIIVIYAYTYFIIVRPFERMEKFAVEIGRGNFDIEINYEKNNLFGAFTWAFDHMRKEIIKVRSSEKEAIENNLCLGCMRAEQKNADADNCKYREKSGREKWKELLTGEQMKYDL